MYFMQKRTAVFSSFAVLLVSFGLLYYKVFIRLVEDWWVDENYSHGFLILPIAFYFAWERRQRFLEAPRKPSWLGLITVVGSVLALIAGVLGAELFTTRIALLGTIAGSILFLCGWQQLRIMVFPIAFLLLMIPIPAIVFNQIAFPLQLLASRFGETALIACQVPVLREGNVINLANTSLEVAEACSGIRSLISLLTLGIVYGYFTDNRIWFRAVLALATIPVAIAANGIRVAGTGVAAHVYGPAAAQGFFHTFSGWLIFVAAFVMLFALQKVLLWLAPPRPSGKPAESAAA
jgi:exosortase